MILLYLLSSPFGVDRRCFNTRTSAFCSAEGRPPAAGLHRPSGARCCVDREVRRHNDPHHGVAEYASAGDDGRVCAQTRELAAPSLSVAVLAPGRRDASACGGGAAGSNPVSRSKNQPSLGGVPDGSLPSQQEDVATAKRTTVGLKKPMESSLDGVSDAYTSKLDGSAMWTAFGKYPTCGATHGSKSSAFAALSAAGTASFRFGGVA